MQTINCSGWLAILSVIVSIISGETGSVMAQPPEKTSKPLAEAYRQEFQVFLQENWVERHLRTFRTYPHKDRANKLMGTNRLAEARQELEKSLAIDPLDLSTRYTYLILLMKLQDYAGAASQADLILQNRPGFVPALLYRGIAHQKLGQAAVAMEDFRAVAADREAMPDDRRLAITMLASLALTQKDYNAALTALNQLESLDWDYGTLLTKA